MTSLFCSWLNNPFPMAFHHFPLGKSPVSYLFLVKSAQNPIFNLKNPSFSWFNRRFAQWNLNFPVVFPWFSSGFYISSPPEERAWDEVRKREIAQGAKARATRATAQTAQAGVFCGEHRGKTVGKTIGAWGKLWENHKNIAETARKS
jgi:hypothetical protein